MKLIAAKSSVLAFLISFFTLSDEEKYKELELTRNEVYESTHVLEKRLRGDLKAATEKALGRG